MNSRKRLIFALAMFVAYIGFIVAIHYYKPDWNADPDFGSAFTSSSSGGDDDDSGSISSSSAGDDDGAVGDDDGGGGGGGDGDD
jgi:hypothetical protein